VHRLPQDCGVDADQDRLSARKGEGETWGAVAGEAGFIFLGGCCGCGLAHGPGKDCQQGHSPGKGDKETEQHPGAAHRNLRLHCTHSAQ